MTARDAADVADIDLTPARGGDPAAIRAVAGSIDRACREIGFFNVIGTGIPDAVIDDAFAAFDRFLALPVSERNACRPSGGPTLPDDPFTPYGYSGLLEENAFAYMGEHGKPSDYVEKFSIGRKILSDADSLPFPRDGVGREMRRALAAHFRHVRELAHSIVALAEVGLGLKKGFFTDRIANSFDSMRCHSYPAHAPELANDQGMGAHKDGSLITLLTHDGPGIEVRGRRGTWIRIPMRSSHHFTVNIGDLLSHWTDGAYVSTPHRVVLTDRPRRSIVFFKLTNEDELTAEGDRQMDALFGR